MTKKASLAIAMLVIVSARAATQNAPPATGAIQGIVTREGTNDPIPMANAVVSAEVDFIP